MPHPSSLVYAKVLEMAAVLGRSNTRPVARVYTKRKSADGRHPLGDTIMGPSGGAALVDYIRLRDFRCFLDITDSVRDTQAFFEIRISVSSRARIEQQYRGLSARLKHALPSRANQQTVGARK
jgi:hypothetical protein